MNISLYTPRLLSYICLLSLIMGCAGVKVKPVSPSEQITQHRGDVLTVGKFSASSQDILRISGQNIGACYDNLLDCQQSLKTVTGITEEQRLSTIAEIWLKIALENNKDTSETASIEAWLEAARYSYAYLFYSERRASERAFEERQTQVRDYYNYASQEAITRIYQRYQQEKQTIKNHEVFQLAQWRIRTKVNSTRSQKSIRFPIKLLAARGLSFSGLRNIYRRDGIGADLIAIMPQSTVADHTSMSQQNFFLEPTYVPITALLRFNGNSLKQIINSQEVELSLFDPYSASTATIAGKKVPISADFTSSYGLWLADSNFSKQAMVNLLGLQGAITHAQVNLMQPYDPNRQTVILLHGLASSPEAWINAANEILGDETLRNHYQVWIVYYPTNAPLPMNNHDIREALLTTLKYFDPSGQAKASQNITLIGHSMGGVLSRLMISSSDKLIWETFEKTITMGKKQKKSVQKELSPYLNFKPLPQVSSAIFIATPHKGTPIANYKLARLVTHLISIPPNMLKQLTNTTRVINQSPFHIPKSIDHLGDKNTFMQLVTTLPMNPSVHYYSIIANNSPNRPLLESTDGAVPYRSAHLEDACSELVINSSHSVQEMPQAILEIRRILKGQITNQRSCVQKP